MTCRALSKSRPLRTTATTIPFAKIPKHVRILMEPDASAAQVMAVFDAYHGDVDDGDIESIEVVLDGPKRATLATAEGIHATSPMVQELVDVLHEDDTIEYRREAYPVGRSVYLTLVPADFDQVVSVADRYRNVDGIDYVGVSSGGFSLVRTRATKTRSSPRPGRDSCTR